MVVVVVRVGVNEGPGLCWVGHFSGLFEDPLVLGPKRADEKGEQQQNTNRLGATRSIVALSSPVRELARTGRSHFLQPHSTVRQWST